MKRGPFVKLLLSTEGEARMLITFQPAGKMEAYFKAISEGTVATMSKEEQEEFRKKHGLQRTGPALNYLKNNGAYRADGDRRW